jgi:hypothetical protein
MRKQKEELSIKQQKQKNKQCKKKEGVGGNRQKENYALQSSHQAREKDN